MSAGNEDRWKTDYFQINGQGGKSTVRESHANVKHGETQKKNLFLHLSRQIYISLKKKKKKV